MKIIAVGINHKTSTIEVREKFYLQPTDRDLLLSELKNDPYVAEAFVLSTCNRTEIYAHLIEDKPEVLIDAIFRVKRISPNIHLRKHFYAYSGREAILHLLRVTTGIDSLVIGEKQILGQMKEALELASAASMMSRAFNILSNIVLQTGKKVRRETQIDFGGSSVSWASVMMAQNIFGSLEDKTILILGSGKMGRLAVEQLSKKGAKTIYVMNRTMEKAQELAQKCGGTSVAFWELKEVLAKTDVCICSSSCVHYLVSHDLVSKTMEKRQDQKLVFIDISVPRAIDPQVVQIPNVSLFAVDDLDKVVQDNIQKRMGAVEQVEEIISQKIDEFYITLEKAESIQKQNGGVYEIK